MALHQEQDQQSLELHSEAIKMMQSDASLIDRALSILDRWCQNPANKTYPLYAEWRRILENRDWNEALSTSDRGYQRRQASPVACVLPNKRRLEIIKSCKKNSLNI